ncbi:MAG: AtzH-like domain-containing protein [Verrucomicrobiota bacterium]
MVVDELKQLFESYERALIGNDVPSLEAFFWQSPTAVRLGPTENLFGSDEINQFRRNRSSVGLQREVTRVEYIVLDDDHGVINVCFLRQFRGAERSGRQTQVWKRFPDLGWKIVSAHVSFLEES